MLAPEVFQVQLTVVLAPPASANVAGQVTVPPLPPPDGASLTVTVTFSETLPWLATVTATVAAVPCTTEAGASTA